jgi:hypothetical protein
MCVRGQYIGQYIYATQVYLSSHECPISSNPFSIKMTFHVYKCMYVKHAEYVSRFALFHNARNANDISAMRAPLPLS